MWAELLGLLLGLHQRRLNAHLAELVHQVSTLVHLQQDVTAAHKLTVQVHLGDGGPVGELLDAWLVGGGGRGRNTLRVSFKSRSTVRVTL